MQENQTGLEGPLLFAEDDTAGEVPKRLKSWRCLIVDDDEGVHQSLAFAMNNLPVLEGRIEWLHAYTAREAREILERERDVAVIMLDVVMEHEQAGLELVRVIRNELGLNDTRIILHTGQPGFAPEITAIREYDINDYRTKAQLTRGHVYTCLSSAIRTYRQIRAIAQGREQLRRIIEAGDELMMQVDEAAFARGVLAHFAQLLDTGLSGFALTATRPDSLGLLPLLVAEGQHAGRAGRSLNASEAAEALACCLQSLSGHGVAWGARGAALCIRSHPGAVLCLYLDLQVPDPESVDPGVIDVFAGHFASCLDNRSLLHQLQHDAYHDRLSGLPNRRALGEELGRCLVAGQTSGLSLALIDIDAFGEINETLGHAFGDELLRGITARLRASATPEVMVARISADIFAVLGAERRITPEFVLPLFAEPFTVGGEESMVSVTVGFTRLGDVEAQGGGEMLEAAFQALRYAKTYQRGQLAWYDPALTSQTHERVRLLNGLRHALQGDGLYVVFQPQVSLEDQRLIGLEALMRWRTEDGSVIPPDRFIPVAEQSGLIRELGFFVLREACSLLARLHAEGHAGVRMAVNVSAVQFRNPSFLSELRQIVGASGMDAHYLELEITESIAMEDSAYVREALEALRTMGVQLAVDDFGTGYSCLAQLKQLAFNRLKIDKAFVHDLSEEEADASIAGVVIQLGQRLGKEVIAEGVETEAQAQILGRLGCREAQGYLYGRPMPVAELYRWLKSRA
ncbi:EAL domain-containing protein [Uliginosibacterium sp. 31-12]|uniref:EAL domain-containing response regulator n=1 Tax=Uliginosibacterium sp. 31-12 TaxID=3062781 RepID=UPI0026E2C7EB|nr:EAL domain-containing protein [Uliginosibacterium sp. 31-12]MDO6387619.1 EAL domain-containing protein [Uliginosibacterium sp. 31-12]